MKLHHLAIGAVAAATLTACGSSSPSNTSTTTPTPTPTPTVSSPTPSASASPSMAPTTAHTAAVPYCTSNIRVINGEAQGAAGHRALVLIFNNVGHGSCRISGYPGLDLVNASGTTVAHASRTLSGMAGGASSVASVILAPGASASALVEASDVPQGSITDCGSYSLMVTPPGQYVSVPAGTAMMPKCELQIHPVVAGTHGGMN